MLRFTRLLLCALAPLCLPAVPSPLAAAASWFQSEERPSPPQPLSDVTIERLDGLGRLWGSVQHFHPWLAQRGSVDWDAALVTAAESVATAEGANEYATAVERMLIALGDPATYLEQPSSDAAGAAHSVASQDLTPDGIFVLHVGDYYSLSGADAGAVLDAARGALANARAVVLDLRSPGPIESYAEFQLRAYVGPFERELIDRPLSTPGQRRRVYYGYPSHQPFASGQYRAGLLTEGGGELAPSRFPRPLPCIVLVNRDGALLEGSTALQAAGRARIVFEGSANELADGDAQWIDLPDGLRVRVRVSEAIFPDGTDAGLRPDALVAPSAAGQPDGALEQALAFARDFEPSSVPRKVLPATARPAADRSYPEMSAPGFGHRILALARFWNVIEHFYPYHHLLDQPWGEAQRELLPRFAAAETALDYTLAVAEMATRIQDSHAYVAGPVFQQQVVPNGYPPIRVRWIEGQPVVASLRHPEQAEGVRIGDVVLTVDGQEANELLMRQLEITSASTRASGLDKAALQFLNGPVGSEVKLTLRGAHEVRSAVLMRRAEDYTTLYHGERTGEVVRILSDNIGYVDLDRLEFADVDAMFERLADTNGILFDMRGYPKGTAWAIAPRLASRDLEGERTVALFTTPMPGHASPEPSGEAFRQIVVPSPEGVTRYGRPTLMLIDERSQSQAEHTGLYLRAANGTRFVGSPTAGADGEITSVVLPGGITVGFTGQSVRHPDGSELQRVGLQPDFEVVPTLEAIRAGRDEVLERAHEVLRRMGSER